MNKIKFLEEVVYNAKKALTELTKEQIAASVASIAQLNAMAGHKPKPEPVTPGTARKLARIGPSLPTGGIQQYTDPPSKFGPNSPASQTFIGGSNWPKSNKPATDVAPTGKLRKGATPSKLFKPDRTPKDSSSGSTVGQGNQAEITHRTTAPARHAERAAIAAGFATDQQNYPPVQLTDYLTGTVAKHASTVAARAREFMGSGGNKPLGPGPVDPAKRKENKKLNRQAGIDLENAARSAGSAALTALAIKDALRTRAGNLAPYVAPFKQVTEPEIGTGEDTEPEVSTAPKSEPKTEPKTSKRPRLTPAEKADAAASVITKAEKKHKKRTSKSK